ncbi:MAG TPA: chemotaxis protein CheW [Stellaceae bacterium]|nr:chemotaxis protein CheW [Stellaceae bacterium]
MSAFPSRASAAGIAGRRRTEAVLRERARALARAESGAETEAQIQLLMFQLAWETYAFEMRLVREVYPLRDLTPVPCTPPFLLGVINLRGELCPVVELKRLLGLPEQGITNATRAVILRDGSLELGVVADVIVGVRSVAAASIGPPPDSLAGIDSSFLRGVGPDGMAVLDASRILRYPKLVIDDQVEE